LRLKIIGFLFSKDVLTAVLIGIAKHACHQYVETDATHKNALPRITDTRETILGAGDQVAQGVFKVPKKVEKFFFLSAV